MGSSYTPRTPKTPNPARLLELTADVSDDIDMDDIIELSIIPAEVHEVFRTTVDSVNAFFSSTDKSISLLVEEMAANYEPLAKSPYKRDVLYNNLITLLEYKRTGGNTRERPSTIEQRAFIDAMSFTPAPVTATASHQTPQAAPAPQATVTPPTPDSKVENGEKLRLALPTFNGEREKWYGWKKKVETKIKLFPSFKKIYLSEEEALKNMELSDVLYGVFETLCEGGAAETLVESASPKTGYHAFKVLQDAMEGDETVDRLSEEVKIKHILHSNSDPMWVDSMLRIKDHVEFGNIKTSEEVFSALSKTETYFATAGNDDDSKPSPTIRKTNGQQVSGQLEKKSVRFEEQGKPDKNKFSDAIMPSNLYETLNPEQQVWVLDWFRTLKKTGSFSAAAEDANNKPSAESVENHKKRRAAPAAGRDRDKANGG
jgi:hypothetical protein